MQASHARRRPSWRATEVSLLLTCLLSLGEPPAPWRHVRHGPYHTVASATDAAGGRNPSKGTKADRRGRRHGIVGWQENFEAGFGTFSQTSALFTDGLKADCYFDYVVSGPTHTPNTGPLPNEANTSYIYAETSNYRNSRIGASPLT
eukprot:scaffold1321_cov402-Prasinococcus_capsulatus_cf.AAC.7